jgi:DNA repair protein RadA/Sms
MARSRSVLACTECRQQVSQWLGRCPGCGAWGTVQEVGAVRGSTPVALEQLALGEAPTEGHRIATGSEAFDRVMGGGIVPGSVTLLAGEPGIGKSTLLLQLLADIAADGRSCLLVSGEESHAQVAARSGRLGIDGGAISFAPGRDLAAVVDLAGALKPAVLAVDSVQTIRDTSTTQAPGGVAQVRACTDALVGLAKAEGIAVIMTGHVTKDGDLAGPRALEHAVDVVLAFEGEPRSGLRVLSARKDRFGPEGETAWFQMAQTGLLPIDPTTFLAPGDRVPGAAVGLPQVGRRSVAVEIHALVGSVEGPPKRHATGLDPRRFQLVTAVLGRSAGIPLARAEVFGAATGGSKLDDPACDLAIAAALASAATGTMPPPSSAFVGEVTLTGLVRPAPGFETRMAAARAAGYSTVIAANDGEQIEASGVRVDPVRTVVEALGWAGI